MTTRAPKIMTARFAGKCTTCGDAFGRGDTIAFNGKAHHPACVDAPPASAPAFVVSAAEVIAAATLETRKPGPAKSKAAPASKPLPAGMTAAQVEAHRAMYAALCAESGLSLPTFNAAVRGDLAEVFDGEETVFTPRDFVLAGKRVADECKRIDREGLKVRRVA